MTTSSARKTSLLQGREGLRFAVMIALAGVIGVVLFTTLTRPPEPDPEKDKIEILTPDVVIPPLKREIVERLEDETDTQRLEPFPTDILDHLLKCASYIGPGSLTTMGLSDPSVDQVRRDPKKFRGQAVAFEGELVSVEKSVPIDGLPFRKTEGLIKVGENESVLFAVLKHDNDKLPLGSFVRIEGFFAKLRSQHFPVKWNSFPFVVGLELRTAFRKFEPVLELDRDVLARTGDAAKRPDKIGQEALYHLTSFVQNRKRSAKELEAQPDLTAPEIKHMRAASDESLRGKEYRILAQLYGIQIKNAKPNPLGVKYWTRAWLKHRETETIQVNIPGRLEGTWKTGDEVIFNGAFLQRLWYEAGLNQQNERVSRIVPLFVADKLLHWRLVDNPANVWIRWGLALVTLLLIGLVAMLVIRDNKGDKEIRDRLLEHRRKRRARRGGLRA